MKKLKYFRQLLNVNLLCFEVSHRLISKRFYFCLKESFFLPVFEWIVSVNFQEFQTPSKIYFNDRVQKDGLLLLKIGSKFGTSFCDSGSHR